MAVSPWIALKALHHLGLQPVLLNAFYRLGLASGHYRRVEDREQRVEKREQEGKDRQLMPLFALPKQEEILAVLGEHGKAALLAEADEIVAGKVRLFGAEPVELQLAFPSPLAHWTAYETDPALLSAHSSLFSDIKSIWEPARFGWAFCLGRAYHLTRDEKYAETFWHNFETFITANPPTLGPNWMSGQEVALRIMAFVWAGQIFSGSSSSSPVRNAALAHSVMVHAVRIPPTLVYARSQQNNHLLTEAAGLLTAGLALPGHPQAARWRKLGWKHLNAGLQSQIDPSGEYAQHSSNYHRLMLQVVLWAHALTRGNDRSNGSGNDRSNDLSRYYLKRETLDAIQRSIHWLLSMLEVESGRVPNLGANDGAYIFPLSDCPFSDYRPVAYAVARAFIGCDLPHGPWDELALWFGRPLEQSNLAQPTFAKVLQPPGELLKQESRFHKVASQGFNLPKGGEDRINGKDSWATLRTVQYANRPSHADQLHLDLWWRGLNVAQDAGTYLYNADPPWDNGLTTAVVHNTVTVNGRDQFRRAGRFLYLDWFNAFRATNKTALAAGSGVLPAPALQAQVLGALRHANVENDPSILQRVRGWHAGYRKEGIRHERIISAYADGRWQIQDDLHFARPQQGEKTCTFRLHWLLPDWEWRVESSQTGMLLQLMSPCGPAELRIDTTYGNKAGITLVRAGSVVHQSGPGEGSSPPEAAIRGWVSPTYSVKIPALSLAIEAKSANDVKFVSEFIFPP